MVEDDDDGDNNGDDNGDEDWQGRRTGGRGISRILTYLLLTYLGLTTNLRLVRKEECDRLSSVKVARLLETFTTVIGPYKDNKVQHRDAHGIS